MAFTLVDWATHSAPVATTYERIILMILADRANMDGTGAYRSKRTLAEAALCDEKTVQNYLGAMRKRGLIGYGDQSLVSQLPKGRRPNVYDVLMPYSQYPSWALEKANQERGEKGLEPLSPATRPDIAPPTTDASRKPRSDKGTKRPERRKEAQSSTNGEGGMTVPPVDNSGLGEYQSPQGGIRVPARGEYESQPGGNDSPPNLSPMNRSEEPVRGTNPPSPSESLHAREGGPEHEVGTSESTPASNEGGGEISKEQTDFDDRCRTVAQSLLRAAAEQHSTIDALDNAGKRELFDLAVAALYREVAGATLREQLTEDLADVRDVVAVLRTRLQRLASSRPSTSTPKTWRPRQERRELADEHIVEFFASDRRFVPSRFKTEAEAAQPAAPADPDAALAALDELLTQQQEDASKARPDSTHTV